LIERIKAGRFPVIGDGKNVADLTYIENVVDALLLCADAGQHTLGKKYNISNGEPVVLWDLIEKIAKSLGYHLAGWHVPYGLADFLAGLMEVIYRFIPGRPEPPLTRYSVGIVALSTTLDITAARQELGYTPRISIEEGVEKFIGWWKETQA
jgi:nucleoside-diphosphate-sugar epimerase